MPSVRRLGLVVLLGGLCALPACKSFLDAMDAHAERNRTVTLTLEGAVFGPGPTGVNGKGWDGRLIPPGYASAVLTAAATYYMPGTLEALGVAQLAQRFSEDVARTVSDRFAGPDSVGTVSVFIGANKVAEAALPKHSNNYTPAWSVIVPNVKIHRARIVVTLWDKDTWSDQLMTKVVISERELLAAESSGELYALDTEQETNGAVLRILVTVSP